MLRLILQKEKIHLILVRILIGKPFLQEGKMIGFSIKIEEKLIQKILIRQEMKMNK